MVTAEPLSPPLRPTAPSTLEEAGLNVDLVLQLALKTLHFKGQLSGTELADRLRLHFSVIEPAFELLVDQHQVEIAGGGGVGRSSFQYRITDAGRTRAGLFLENNHYVGAAPVPLAQYQAYMQRLSASARVLITREALHNAVSEKLVVNDRVLDQLGPAINARHSLFLYGPPGNGKSVMSAAMSSLLLGGIEIPHALEFEGSIIQLFDPAHHDPLPAPAADSDGGLDQRLGHDDRWVDCHRPIVTVGGELELEHLDLIFTPGMGFYQAPIQTKANGGMLLIDDFGRQRCSPQALLNRWIVPLETNHDHLTLKTGQKINVPFSVFVVFATNIKPGELVDEAFLRRIHFKVFAQSPTIEEFLQIFENCCRERQIPFERTVVEDLLERYYRPRQLPLRGCHPRDLLNHVISLAEYSDRPRVLTSEMLDAACASYFVDDREQELSQSIWQVLPPV